MSELIREHGWHVLGELAVLAIVTLPASRTGTPTANLHAPLVLNLASRLGRQLVLQTDRWGMTEPVRLGDGE